MKKNINEILSDIPFKAGVYLMKDINNNIIYVGKAKVLKNRVKSYFVDRGGLSIKTRALVEHIEDIEYIVTESEHEAFALESNLIKQFMPRYNIMLKDDKHYPYIRINIKNNYPRIEVVRRVKDDGAKYFGPYFSSISMRKMIDVILKTYKIRTCNKDIDKIKGKERPCLNFDLGKCLGVCTDSVSSDEYRKIIDEIIEFLSGNTDKILDNLSNQMSNAAADMKYETAAELRDMINGIKTATSQEQRVILTAVENFDLFAVYHDEISAVAHVMICRAGKIIGSESFHMDMPEGGSSGEIITYFLNSYYTKDNIIPDKIYLSDAADSNDDLSEYLSDIKKSRVNIQVPQRGRKKNLINLAIENAKQDLEQSKKLRQRNWEKTGGAIESLKEKLNLKTLPLRIEGYDISNIQGTDTVASMVVFENGAPSRKEYRRFKIKTVSGSDDFKSMAEVISRRFIRAKIEISEGKTNSFAKLPDLIVIDGGKGQLSSAKKIIDDLGFGNISIIGLAKREEEIFSPNNSVPIILDKRDPALHVMQRLRDEAHRFAITYHRSLRNKRTLKSILDEIEGIGEKRKRLIQMNFPSISAIKNADIESLSSIPGMSKKAAENVYNFFNSSKEEDN